MKIHHGIEVRSAFSHPLEEVRLFATDASVANHSDEQGSQRWIEVIDYPKGSEAQNHPRESSVHDIEDVEHVKTVEFTCEQGLVQGPSTEQRRLKLHCRVHHLNDKPGVK